MKAIVVTDQAAGTAGMKLMERPEPQEAALANLSGANYGDVFVQVHAYVRHFAEACGATRGAYFLAFQRFPYGDRVALFACVGDQERENDS